MGRVNQTVGAIAVAAGLAGGLAACGDEQSSTGGSSPAGIVPATSPLYGESVIRPEGEERETIERVIAAATGEEDPGAFVTEKLNDAIAESDSDLTYEDDIEPWLGERAAFFYPDAEAVFEENAVMETGCVPLDSSIDPDDTLGTELGGDTCASSGQGDLAAVVVQSTDADAAREVIEKAAAEESDDPPKEASYKGVDYLADSEGTAAGVVGDFVVAGSEDAFKAAVDTEAGGDSLADADSFTDTVAAVGEDPTASLYVDSPALLDAAEERGVLDAATAAGLDLSFGAKVTEAPVALGAQITAESVSFTSSTGADPDAELEQSAMLEEVPADAWAAAGASAVGERFSEFVEVFSEMAPDEFEVAEEEFNRQTGFELADLYEPLGDVAVFVSGTSPLSVQGAAVIETSDPETSGNLLKSLEKLALRQGEEVTAVDLPGVEGAVGFEIPAEGAPGSVLVFQTSDRLVVAYGEGAATVAAGVEDTETLVDSDGFTAAVEALGDDYEVGAYVDAQAIAELVGTIPAPGEEITPEQVADALEAFDFLVAGARVDDDRRSDRYVLGLSD